MAGELASIPNQPSLIQTKINTLFNTISISLIKDLFRQIQMQVERQNNKENKRINFDNKIFEVREQTKGKVLITFNDTKNKLVYTCNQGLQKINFRTILSALTSEDQPIVRAFPNQKTSKEYHLNIKVAIQFLSQIEETLVFIGEKISEEQIHKLKRQNENRVQLDKLQEEIIDLLGVCSESGKANSCLNKVQISLQVPFETTIYSISLDFQKLKNNIVVIRFYYWDKVTKTKIQNNQMPIEGIQASKHTQFTVIGRKTSFPKALITIQGEFQSLSYEVKYQKVIKSQPIKQLLLLKNIAVLSAISLFIYLVKSYLYNEAEGQL